MNKKFFKKIIARSAPDLQMISACCSEAKVKLINIKKELLKEHIKINIKKFINNQNFELELANRNFDFALLNISEL